jgi:hypothetical protein
MKVVLNDAEMNELRRQNPASKSDGGFQSLLVGLQERLDAKTKSLSLSETDIQRIQKYASEHGRGGWQNRLQAIFGRTLGPKLDGKG